jgi:hypothetical protein
MRRRWFRFGFYAPFAFWWRGFHGPWPCVPWPGSWGRRPSPYQRLQDHRQWLQESRQDLQQMRQELEKELKEMVEAELERLRRAQQEEGRRSA